MISIRRSSHEKTLVLSAEQWEGKVLLYRAIEESLVFSSTKSSCIMDVDHAQV